MPVCGPASVVYDPTWSHYDFGPDHPMAPARLDLTMRLAERLGVTAGSVTPDGLPVVTAPPADDERLATVHDEELIEAVRRAGEPGGGLDLSRGLGSQDNPVFPGMHDAAAGVVGATLDACRRVWEGRDLHSASIAGGLHHAMPQRVSGFCIYNDVAVGIRWLLEQGARRVAYVDIDVHHGDGVERIFWDDPRVLTVSLHETGEMLFPGTGQPHDLGSADARGSAVNVALPPGTSDGGWLRAFHAVVPPLLREWKPEILLTQHGCDTHQADPLAHLMLTVDGQRAAYLALHDLAHELTGGRWVATGGGGYAIGQVVPRAWTHLLAVVSGRPLDPATATPEEWRAEVRELVGEPGPHRMTDGRTPAWRDWSEGMNPDTWLDRTIHATRLEAFPLHGLDPWG